MVEVDPGQPQAKFIMVSGPSRSGKSRWAESLVSRYRLVTYVATSPSRPEDAGWQERIRRHRERRPSHWSLVESGPDLSEVLRGLSTAGGDGAVLIDALGGFVASHLDQSERNWHQSCDDLSASLASMAQTRVLVVEETGWGVVPPTAIGGLFRDRLGQLGQRLTAEADDSWLVVQGRAINLHQLGQPVP